MQILMIEDNESVAEMMQMFFINEGWEATFKYDGKEGLDAFLADPDKYDIITLDLNLPSMDGMIVAKEIRKVSNTVSGAILLGMAGMIVGGELRKKREDK